MKHRLVIFLLLTALILIVPSCQPAGSESVLLQGAVTIGPLSPVEKPGENPVVPPEVFSARKLLLYDGAGKRLIREIYFTQIGRSAAGYYTAQIAPGTYTLALAPNGIDRADNLPQKITVSADETLTIDVNIDTGIR